MFMRRQRGRSSNQRRITHLANAFTGADQRAAVATDAGAAGIAWLIVRQGFFLKEGRHEMFMVEGF